MGKSISRGALWLAVALVSAASASAQEQGLNTPKTPQEVESAARQQSLTHWLGAPYSREIGTQAAAALERFGPWAAERGYVGYLSRDQSVLYFALARRSAQTEVRLIESVEQRFAALLPDPRSRHPAPITGTGGPTTRVYALGGDVPVWKHDLVPIDHHCGVLFELDRDTHYDELLAFVDTEPARHLGEPQRSFLTPDVGAWIWRVGSVPDAHQLAQGAAQFVLERRFPHLPEWLRDGLAWHVERDVLGSVRCLTESRGESSRDFAAEWELKERVRPFQGTWVERLASVTPWQTGATYVDQASRAYVFVDQLLECDPQSLASAVDELRLHWEDYSMRHDASAGWQRRTEYRTPLHTQGRVLAPLLDGPRLAHSDGSERQLAGE